MDEIFKDLLVVELASVFAGPSVGMFFAELGAHVIKIENPQSGGDMTRQWKLPTETQESLSAYYQSVNWGKDNLFIDLKDEEARAEVYELIKSADIVITNFQEQQSARLGVSAEKIFQINPSIILAQIHAYAKEDERKGFDMVMQAESGFLSMTGTKDGIPAKIPVALIDLIAAHQLKQAILIAMLQKMKDGKGRKVEVSLFKSAIASLVNQASNYLVAGHVPKRLGTEHPNIAPYGDVFKTRNGAEGVFAIGSDRQFCLLCEVLNLSVDFQENYKLNQYRVQHRNKLMKTLNKEIGKFSKITLDQLFIDNGIPFGWVKSMEEVFADELAAEMILERGGSHSCVSSISFSIHLIEKDSI